MALGCHSLISSQVLSSASASSASGSSHSSSSSSSWSSGEPGICTVPRAFSLISPLRGSPISSSAVRSSFLAEWSSFLPPILVKVLHGSGTLGPYAASSGGTRKISRLSRWVERASVGKWSGLVLVKWSPVKVFLPTARGISSVVVWSSVESAVLLVIIAAGFASWSEFLTFEGVPSSGYWEWELTILT